MKVYELKIKDNLESSIQEIALVNMPAIEVGFVMLSKDKSIQVKLALNEEKRMIYTPVLIPEQRILRQDEGGEPYQIFFSKETIRQTAQDYLKQGTLVSKFNNEHNANEKLEGVTVVESWIVDSKENDKSVHLGFDLPEGTWMQGIKVDNEAIWKMAKEGTYNGISIEGLFENFETQLNSNQLIINNNSMDNKVNEAAKGILAKLSEILAPKTKLGSAEIDGGGVVYFEGEELEDGKNVFSDEAMEMPMEDGEYVLSNGKALLVSGGIVASLMEIATDVVVEDELNKETLASEELAKSVLELATAFKTLRDEFDSYKSESANLAKEKEELTKESEAKVESLEKENTEIKAELSKIKIIPSKETVTKLTSDQPESRFGALKNKVRK